MAFAIRSAVRGIHWALFQSQIFTTSHTYRHASIHYQPTPIIQWQ